MIPKAEGLTAADMHVIGARTLKSQLRRAERMNQVKAYLLIMPLFAFLLVSFLLPIGSLLIKSFNDPTLPTELPETSRLLRDWDPSAGSLPGEEVFSSFAAELAAARANDGASRVGTRLNLDEAGMRSLILKTVRKIDSLEGDSWQEKLVGVDERWGNVSTWSTIKYAASPWTIGYYIKALDFKRDVNGDIIQQAEGERLYRDVFVRTAWVSLSVSAICLLLGYPVAYFLAALPPKFSNPLMILVLLPFWTSILVRTTAWVVVLQTNGVLNSTLIALGITEEALSLIYNRFGVLVAMTHVLLPYAILSLYSVMKGVPPIYVKAARSLGAGPIRAFFQAYFPQTLPGVGAAGMLTFILAVGYYITPAIVGGANDQLASYYIANHVNSTLNWGLASALASMLLVGVLALYSVFVRLTGGAGAKLG